MRDLFRGTIELLARRMTEQASHSGEHYITASRSEFFAMYRAAAGAGLIIAVTGAGQDPTREARVAAGLGSRGVQPELRLGFVLIHVLHLTIATKQPAMTAATLAA